MEQKFVLTHRTTTLKETKQTWPILDRPTLKQATFLRKYNEKRIFCGHIILLEGVFFTQLSGNAGISV
jgi:hypothetical protein